MLLLPREVCPKPWVLRQLYVVWLWGRARTVLGQDPYCFRLCYTRWLSLLPLSGHSAHSSPALGGAGGWTRLCHRAQVWPWPRSLKPEFQGWVPKRPRPCPPLLSPRAVGLTGWTGSAAARWLGKTVGTPAERRRETLPKRAKLPLPPRPSQEQGEAPCPGEPGWRPPRARDPATPQPGVLQSLI